MADNMPHLPEPRRTANPFGPVEPQRQNTAAVEMSRAIAEVQARVVVARSHPRDPVRAVDRILNDCTRVTLAEKALYAYARGGTSIEGPSIRLAECLMQGWGNMACGISEVSRHDGVSECVAWSWDLESNTYDEKRFQVRHWRDTREGGYQLKDERDIYELIANMGARRKRACILTVIPGDVVEAATAQCRQTLVAKADTSIDAVTRLVEAFDEFGVTKPMIEARIQRRLEAIRPAQVVMLRGIYNSLKDGVADVADHFPPIPLNEAQDAPGQPQPQAAAQSRGRGRRRAEPPQPQAPAPPAAADETPAPTPTPTPAAPPRTVRFE